MRVDTPEEVAALMAASWGLGLASGVSIANPVPAQDEMAPVSYTHLTLPTICSV